MSISRTRNTQHKVYIPSSARENQYIIAKFKVTDELIEKISGKVDESSTAPYKDFYQKLSKTFFDTCNEFDLESCQFVGNDKFTRVRYSPERMAAQTNEQILFLYNPRYHTSQSAWFDGTKRVKKITLVYLTNGEDIRAEAPIFHQKVKQAIAKFSKEVGFSDGEIRVCDHQHLTYDLYSKEKGVTGTQTHKLRPIDVRYRASNVEITAENEALTYATAELQLNRRIQQLVEIDQNDTEPYNGLYNLIADAFINAAKKHNLANGAVIANDLVPFVRTSKEEIVVTNGELQKLGYNPENTDGGYICKWSSDQLVDTVNLIFVASNKNQTSHGHGKFLNQVELALRSMAEKLDYVPEKEELKVRLHQHVGFNM